MGRHTVSWIAAVGLTAPGLAGCVVSAGPAGLDGHYLGYVRIVAPPTTEPGGRLNRATALGAWMEVDRTFGGAAGVGFRRTQRVEIPRDCRLAVIVRNGSELAEARALAATMEGGGGCAIDATDQE